MGAAPGLSAGGGRTRLVHLVVLGIIGLASAVAITTAEAAGARDVGSGWERTSRPAMGTIVGVTVRPDPAGTDPGPTFDAVYAAIEAGEAALSEWRADSLVARMNRGEAVVFPPDGDGLLARSEALRVATGGAFSLTWAGGRLVEGPRPTWRVDGGEARLGGVLKGFLVDRAADVLAASPFRDWIVDAAGDVRAAGDAGDGRPGWPVVVLAGGAPLARVRLVDAALSTSGGDRQPGHIRDARSGEAATCVATVSVLAPDGETADALATAMFAGCAPAGLVEERGAFATWIDAAGRQRFSAGARARFKPAR